MGKVYISRIIDNKKIRLIYKNEAHEMVRRGELLRHWFKSYKIKFNENTIYRIGYVELDNEREKEQDDSEYIDDDWEDYIEKNKGYIEWEFMNLEYKKKYRDNIVDDMMKVLHKKKYNDVMNELLYSPDLGFYKNMISDECKKFFNIN